MRFVGFELAERDMKGAGYKETRETFIVNPMLVQSAERVNTFGMGATVTRLFLSGDEKPVYVVGSLISVVESLNKALE